MNKAFLLTICLLFASFTGCVDNSEDNDDLTSEIESLTEENKDLYILTLILLALRYYLEFI